MNITGRPHDDQAAELEWLARRAGHVAKAVKGVLVALTAALALELTEDAGAAALGLFGTVMAVFFGSAYGDWMQADIESKRPLSRAQTLDVFWHSIGVGVGAAPALILFVLAWLGTFSTEVAIDLAIWSGMGLLFAFGYAGGRLRGDPHGKAALHGMLLAAIGVGVLLLKTLH